jgi:membrane protein DedA with SNARE-associated domain
MSEPQDLGGLTGWVADVITDLGATGVGLLVALESVVPPVPSELVLAMSGYLASQDRVGLVAVFVAATLGAVVGALALYGLGRALGVPRLRRWLDRLPLVDARDLDRSERWFERYGSHAVFFGRMMPVVRSLVSIPAGAERMPLPRFLALTTAGSGLWNALFIGLGFTLGDQWQDVEQYGRWFDGAILATFAVMIAVWIIKRLRTRAKTSGRS